MQQLNQGKYYGAHNQELNFNNFLITDTVYTHDKVDWHYHENPYFTFLLEGKLYEANKKEDYYLESGSLLFHNWQDAHHNIKPPEHTRGFHIELTKDWFNCFDISLLNIEGSLQLENPFIKQNIYNIFLETKKSNEFSKTNIELLLLNSFSRIETYIETKEEKQPHWVNKVLEIIHDSPELCMSLTSLALELNIHPVHLSRQFPKYFKTSLGNYIKYTRLNKAVSLIINKGKSMTEIAVEVGFYDQSHFTNLFKKEFNITPLAFRKKTQNVNFIQF
ncbi:AraC family transcriptional regulator [Tenacibaculum holothuriorum]|uniref:AraC family transcriptional regulator n=1 Tax=Tenacibaculum holothuriorum TaxID=1635173 RepID=A0A1Y2PFQ9_9FLAO|nr:helix-turn-helix domain-containing protein [Tenacibaculum holothuriorum]OSY89265.1 AraC family transcriptional regulator [Tenacibaculum holothuriorum]